MAAETRLTSLGEALVILNMPGTDSLRAQAKRQKVPLVVVLLEGWPWLRACEPVG